MGHALRASTSIGIAFYPDDASDAPTLMKSADAAMYAAKAVAATTSSSFSADLNAEALRFFQLEQKLRHAVGNRELVLYYQPQVDTSAHRVCALEALVRWQSRKSGLVPPAEFIPVAEETGLSSNWANGSCASLPAVARMARGRLARVPVAVNLPPGSSSSAILSPASAASSTKRPVARHARTRDHRIVPDAQRRRCPGAGPRAGGDGHPAGDRRFRHRLFQPLPT